jgi:prephenate dehydratase
MTRVSYLGPQGTFCHEAALSQPDLANSDLVAEQLISDVFEAVDTNSSDLGMVPLENTIEGSVSLTLDMLVFDSEAMIQREIDHNISLCLASTSNAKKEDITTVISHPHALAQCRSYIDEQLTNATTRATDSTAGAAATLAHGNDTTTAVICPKEAAQRYGLTILDAHIQDRDFNETRFILIGRDIPAPTGNDKTSIVCFQRANRPGSLLEIMKEFADRNIDFTKLESRPTKEGLGQYCFIMDFEGHLADENIAACLEKVRTEYADVKFLGSYPVAGSKAQSAPEGTTKVWKDTPMWLADLLAKVEK